jgi:undecaprenyl diphosphate synthase
VSETSKVRPPGHIAIIMDGNGRWATERGLARRKGHEAGADSMERITEHAREIGVRFLTLYSFSSENWKRPRPEVDFLMRLLESYLRTKLQKLIRNGIRFRATGHVEDLPRVVRKLIAETEEKTASEDGMTLNLALSYSGRLEILDAVRVAVASGKAPHDEAEFQKLLYAPDIPDPDLLVRTGGELRISNFLLWQSAYTELYFTKKYWPDFGSSDLDEAIAEYRMRERRFGDVRAK